MCVCRRKGRVGESKRESEGQAGVIIIIIITIACPHLLTTAHVCVSVRVRVLPLAV